MCVLPTENKVRPTEDSERIAIEICVVKNNTTGVAQHYYKTSLVKLEGIMVPSTGGAWRSGGELPGNILSAETPTPYLTVLITINYEKKSKPLEFAPPLAPPVRREAAPAPPGPRAAAV